MSWIPHGRYKIVEEIRGILSTVVEPYVNLFRRLIPPLGGIDFSPLVAMIALEIGWNLLARILLHVIIFF